MAKQLFGVPFALELMGKSVNKVLDKCEVFNPQLLPINDPELNGLINERSPLSDAEKEFKQLFDATVGYQCLFRLADYQALSFVGINFINDKAVECIISLGKPSHIKRYSQEYEVLRTVVRKLESEYHNGRVQGDDQAGRAYTWRTDDCFISFISYPEFSPKDTGVRLGIQIRDARQHPHRNELELWYNEAKHPIPQFV